MRIKTIYHWFFSVSMLVGLLSCSDDNSDLLGSGKAVISGYIYAGSTIDSLRITEVNSYAGDGTLTTLDDMVVTVTSTSEQVILHGIGNGFYQSSDLIVKAGETYDITFEWGQQQVFAETYVPEFNPIAISANEVYREKQTAGFAPGNQNMEIDNLEITWTNASGDYYFVLIENIEEDPEYINSFFEERISAGEVFQRPMIRTEPEVTDFHVVNNRSDIQQFGLHRVIVYRLNPEYAALYQSLGTSSLTIEDPPTNVVNGLGIFTGITTDTVFFDVKKI